MVSQDCSNEMSVYRLIPGQFKLRKIFLLTADPGVGLPLILYGVALEVLLLTGVVAVQPSLQTRSASGQYVGSVWTVLPPL